ncbi:MBL fold metallo-hydrolase [uncultured Pseudoteredinibacter sp.]|uniref:MBL fold metallo-hydrolase n=1 Tax=uncultured Pseudoteredinibacter sp. TaxID=1641701 RepID=UPI002615A367|nr:MBL fold metallo-hydrolase [uncultured Pseudoteredinibacter sp.]
MNVTFKFFLSLVVSIFCLILSSCELLQPVGNINIEPIALLGDGRSKASLSSHEGVRVTAYVTGWVKAPAKILIDQDSPDLPSQLQSAKWVPSIAYAIHHPEYGVVIMDAGLKRGECDYGLRPFYWVPCRNDVGADLVSQLIRSKVAGEDIIHIIPSHFHGDHISGLGALLAYSDAELLLTQASLDELRSPLRAFSGVPSKMIGKDMKASVIDSRMLEDPLLGQSFDVFSDGSLLLFATPGHSAGHLSALVKTNKNQFLLSFDASHIKENMQLGIPSGASSSPDQALDSLQKLSAIMERINGVKMIYGHEPSQWACVNQSIDLDVLLATC